MNFLCVIAAFGCLWHKIFQFADQPAEMPRNTKLFKIFYNRLRGPPRLPLRDFARKSSVRYFGSVMRYETVVSPTFRPSCHAMPSLKK